MTNETPYRTPLVGHEDATAQFLEAAQSQRLHHAWLLTGPQGIGKAHFAWQAAAYLLDNQHMQSNMLDAPGPLDALHIAATSQAFGQMAASSHPDFRYVAPDIEKAKAQISVDQIRSMSSMFVTTAGMGGWRIAVIDAAEDMNRNAANAILKLLEEPPARCLFFLISHAPGKLLPTIRSRCRTLAFKSLAQETTRTIMRTLRPQADTADIDSVLSIAQGAPGRALALLDGNAADYLFAVDQVFQTLPQLHKQSVLGLADLVGDRPSSGPFEVVWDLIDQQLCIAAKAVLTRDHAQQWAEALPANNWLTLQESMADRKGQALGLNLSPRHVLLSFFSDLGQMLQRATQ